jgi:hypothetical protein
MYHTLINVELFTVEVIWFDFILMLRSHFLHLRQRTRDKISSVKYKQKDC